MIGRLLKTIANVLIDTCLVFLFALVIVFIFPPILVVLLPFAIVPAWVWIVVCVIALIVKWDYIKRGKDDE